MIADQYCSGTGTGMPRPRMKKYYVLHNSIREHGMYPTKTSGHPCVDLTS